MADSSRNSRKRPVQTAIIKVGANEMGKLPLTPTGVGTPMQEGKQLLERRLKNWKIPFWAH